MLSPCPPEVWHEILWLACTDTGFTGRSISLTSRLFHELSKPAKLCSVGLRGVVQIIDFLNLIEQTPVVYRRVENLFISTHTGCRFRKDLTPDTVDELVKLYKPRYDIWVEQLSSGEEMIDDDAESKFHAVTRILSAVAPTLKNLYIIFTPIREFILPHIHLPQLVDLVVQGRYKDSALLRPEAAPTFEKLRRLRLTDVHASLGRKTFKAIVASAPNLTHLRLDHSNPSQVVLYSDLIEFLDGVSQDGVTTRKSPSSLKKLFLYPGMLPPSGSFVYGRISTLCSMSALQTLGESNPRFILMNRDPYAPRSEYEVNKGLDAWLSEINGQSSCWDEPAI
ncbi:hypothetical protein M413DRAFT_66764 [Hebeloma cylindrosporum]|uniref:Uncharacterized protein n=1 Tax=Hebeloma cylindrosporum TaxID=76867 RepID=A0A0C3CMC6_HEBCY|nr:hypothetical protein M413DRAFT_66764 [Hebeloma cylindrosporum h7]